MRKYVDIVVDALIFKDKCFSWYIFIRHGPHLFRIMEGFFSCMWLTQCLWCYWWVLYFAFLKVK
jgi:hypothetical protein